jgi:peroxiredoxin
MSVGPAPQPGEAAPLFLLSDLQGQEVGLAQHRGQPVILNFWATWCAPCIFEMPELQSAYEAHREDGLVILGLNRDEEQAVVSDFLADDLTINIDFPILLDEQAIVADSYGVLNMPTTYFIDAEGIVSAVHRGPLTQAQIDAYLDDMS